MAFVCAPLLFLAVESPAHLPPLSVFVRLQLPVATASLGFIFPSLVCAALSRDFAAFAPPLPGLRLLPSAQPAA